MGIAVLGPVEVDGHADGLSPRDRVVLSAMVVRAGEPISPDALADALWGQGLPATWAKVVQGCVVRLRKRLGAAAIESGPFGYRLTVTEDELDHRRFERLIARGTEALAGGDPPRSAYLAQEALDLWRGKALPDLADWEPGRVEAARLEALRMDAEELYVEAETRAGRARSVLERARALVAEAPFRERRWALLATALHQAGRQAEALGAVKRARAMLVEELGLDPGHELVELEHRLLRQDPSLTPAVGREASTTCPYRGLLPYGADDADSFFGREDDVAACLRRLRDSRVLAVIGPSGVGKSSLVRAGVVASLIRSGSPVLVTTPGAHPVDSLSGLKPRGRQALVVDQAEEAVTVCTDPAERERYFAALAAHVGAGGCLVLSLRADHLGDLAPYPDIARVLEDGLYLLGPMSEPDLRSAIEGPARRAGLRLEPGLVDLLVREVEGEPAALPMLSHVLRETWGRREGPTLTVEGYRLTGGIRHAVAQSAESLYEAMDDTQRRQLRSLLLRLVTPTDDGDPVRARVPRAKVAGDDAHGQLVERLVDARLVSIDGDTVQIAHEALVKVWPRLRGWLDDDVEGQRLFRHLAAAADAWDAMGRPEGELYRGARLSRVLEWQRRVDPHLSETEAAFIAASVAMSETEFHAAKARIAHERTINRRLRGALGGVAALLVLSLVAGVVAVRSAERARRNQDRAEASADLADARRASEQALVQDDPATSLLLGVAALDVDASPQSWQNLAATLVRTSPLVALREAGGLVVSLAASPDGSLVAASLPGEGEGVQLFDAASLAPVEFDDNTPASAVAFSPDGKLLAMAVNQFTGSRRPRIDRQPIRLYEMPSGTRSDRQLGGFPEGSTVQYSLDFSGDGRRVAAVVQHFDGGSFSDVGVATVWDLASPSRPVFRVPVPEDAVATLSPDGRRLYAATGGERPVRVYDVGSHRLLRYSRSAHGDDPVPVAIDLSPDGSTLAVATADRVTRFDAATLAVQQQPLRGHIEGDVGVEYSPDGTALLSSSVDGSVVIWDAASGSQARRLAARRAASWNHAAFGSGATAVYTSSHGQLMAWDLTGRRDLLAVGRATDPVEPWHELSLPAPDGRTIARVRSGRLWFVDDTTGHETAHSTIGSSDQAYTWSPDSRWLLSSGDDGVLKLWSSVSGELIAERAFRAGVRLAAAFSPDSKHVYVADGNLVMVTLDRASMRPAYDDVPVGFDVVALVPHPRDGSVFAVREDGSFVRALPGTGAAGQWSAGTLAEGTGVPALSPDGSLMAAPTPDGYVGLLDIDSSTWVRNDAREPWAGAVSYAPDGSQFASVQSDRIRLWDGRTGRYQASLPLPSGTPQTSISYLPDSTGLLVAAVDGRTWTVDTRRSTWVQRACAIAGRNLTRAEWQEFFPGRPYDATCPAWPAED